jgi:polar amino acid transport system substrate-binding protein
MDRRTLLRAAKLGTVLAAGMGLARSGVPAAQAATAKEILSKKKIRLGVIPYPPMTVLDPKTQKFSGLWVDGPKYMYEQMGLEVELVETKWSTFASALQSDQFDVFVGGSFATPRRAAAVEFSQPVMYMGHSASIRKEDAGKFKTMSDIDKSGVTVATVLGSSGHEYLRQNFKNATVRTLDTGDLTAGSLEVLAGRADAAVQDAFKIAQMVKQHPNNLIDLFGSTPFYVLPLAYAVAKGNSEFLQMTNTALEWMESAGKWQELAQPYKGQLDGVYYIDRVYKAFG